MTDLISAIDDLLPQTQCGKCGHEGCLPYARAVANGESHNRCPPGGQQTADALAALLGRPSLPLDDRGYADATVKKVAWIREDECIGCTKCIQACPVDAIVGAARLMHTVITDECTGCDLCVEPCPVDCIDMLPVADPDPSTALPPAATARALAERARNRFQARQQRLAREQAEKEKRRQARRASHHQQENAMSADSGPSNQPPLPLSPATPAAGCSGAGENERHAQLVRLKSAYKTAHKQYKQANAALERMQRHGENDALAATQARVAALKARADHCRQQVDELMNAAKADITRLTGKDMKTLKLEAARAEIALADQQRALAAQPNADAATLARLHQDLEACKQTALAARQALVQALHQQGLHGD